MVARVPEPGGLRLLLIPMLRAEEGLRLTVYDDANGQPIRPGSVVVGHPSVGWGRALDVRGITAEEAEALLAADVDAIFAALNEHLPWWQGLTPRRQAVVAAMCYQMGLAGLLKFRATLRAMQLGDYDTAAHGMLASLWAKQTPARAKRMAAQMREG